MQTSFGGATVLVGLLCAPILLSAQDTAQVRDSVVRQEGQRVDPSDTAKKLPKVVVTASKPQVGYVARRTFSATRSDLPLLDVPQAVSVIAKELIADQAMQSMSEVIRYVPGVSMGQGEGHRDAPTIRGNSTTADFFVDGVRDDAQYLRDLYNVEQVEILKGANAMIFGRGGGGGVINRVSKEAQWAPLHTVTLEGGSFAHKRATLDVGDGIGRSFAARLTGMAESSEHFRDASVIEREGLNPTVALLVGGTLIRAGYEYFADRRTVNRGIPSFNGRPSNAAIETFFGDPDQSPSRTAVQSGGILAERGWSNGLTLRNRTRLVGYEKFYQNVYPGAVNGAGTNVDILAYNSTIDRTNFFNQFDASYAIGTGPIRHGLMVGADYGYQATDNHRNTGYFAGDATTYSASFEEPTVRVPVTYRQSATDADNHVVLNVAAAFLQNQMTFGPHWQGVVGLRYERFALDFKNNRNGQTLWREDLSWSPRAGLVFKPFPALSAYGTYSVSYLPASGDQFGSLTATTQTLEPESFTNKEGGVKWEVRPDFVVTGSVYRLDRTNTAAPAPDNSSRLVQTGHQRSTGVELGASGNVTSRWQVAGGIANQRALLLSTTSAAKAGASVPLVPRTTVSLWNRFQIVPLVAAAVGAVHQTDMFAAIDNKVTLPGFTRFDAAGYVKITAAARAQINVENIFNRRYYATSHGNNNIMPGSPRSVRVSITATP